VAFGTYVSLFPQLIAGPIVRYRDVNDQLAKREHSMDKFASGVRRFTVGFAKKLLLGDAFAALYAYLGTSGDFEPSMLGAWVMMAAYTLHIYFDFSGYSDMAIGLGRMIGFEFLENFNYPYLASSITDFWRRWHMSLSSWFREYVYIPLGGNRKGLMRQIFNMAVVWLLTGFWHGAAWNFILWGLFFAVLLVVEKVFFLKKLDKLKVLGRIYVLFAVMISFILFNAASVSEAISYIGGLFGIGGAPLVSGEALYYLGSYALVFIFGIIGATPIPKIVVSKVKALQLAEPVFLALLLVVVTAYLVDGSFNPFLYFRF
jgi:alginate O-acetyltransferase complex protein AlgI